MPKHYFIIAERDHFPRLASIQRLRLHPETHA